MNRMILVGSCELALTKTKRKPIQSHQSKTLLLFKTSRGGGGSESMDKRGCAILALELVPKNLTFTKKAYP